MAFEGEQGRTTYPDVGAHFNRMAPSYDGGCEKVAWNGPQILVGELARFPVAANRPLRLVDFGAGTGLVGKLFKEQFPGTLVTGIDVADRMIEEALGHGRIDEGKVGGIEALQLIDSESAHIVTASGVLDFIHDTAPLVAEFTRILKVGGHFALTYEPAGTAQDGIKSLQHCPIILSEQFAAHGCEILLNHQHPGAYTNYKTQQPVTNNVMIGTLAHRR